MEFYIRRARRIHGPTATSEMRSWLAYGSLQPDDLVRRSDETEWFPARLFPELASDEMSPAEDARPPARQATSWKPNDSAVHCDFDHVPAGQRQGVVIWRLLTGFICRPMTLWRTVSTVRHAEVYRSAKDENGHLLTWPHWIRGPVTAMAISQAMLWIGLAAWATPQITSVSTEIVEHARDAWREATMTTPPPASLAR